MKLAIRLTRALLLLGLAVFGYATAAGAASPSAEEALKLLPVQEGVEFAQPTAEEIANCKISARKIDGRVGWVVEDPAGLPLRKFLDGNGDNVVDLWSYYKHGLEVYRDIDADFNGKADQYRWFHTGGSRWGLDKNEDGKIDAWKTISAEELSAEVVAALGQRDAERFAQLVLKPEELKALGLGKEKNRLVAEKIGRAVADFKTLAATQKTVSPKSKWLQFSGTRPGIVPEGTDGSTRDVRVYENVTAIISVDDQHGQVQIGTLIQLGDVWRVIDVPRLVVEGQDNLASGFFFQTPQANPGEVTAGGTSAEAQKLMDELEKLDQAAGQATSDEEKAKYNVRRAALLEKIAAQAASGQDRALWIRQLADMIGAAVQSGTFPNGTEKLDALFQQLESNPTDKALAPYVKFRLLTAAYGLSLQAPKPDFAKIQAQWLKDLEQYAADYPKAEDSSEALLQLAIAKEFAGQENEGKKLYAQILKDFPTSPAAKKAAGARTRLGSIGKTIQLSGRSPSGGGVDLAKYRGKVVLIQYWATWCEPCKSDFPMLKELLSKYGQSLSIIGISLDSSRKDLTNYLAQNRLPWPQIYEEGGLDSRPANELGILTVPTMILVDQQGRVVNYSIQTAELDKALKKLIRTPAVTRKSSSSRSDRR